MKEHEGDTNLKLQPEAQELQVGGVIYSLRSLVRIKNQRALETSCKASGTLFVGYVFTSC